MNKILLLIFVSLLAISANSIKTSSKLRSELSTSSISDLWNSFKSKFGRAYNSTEEAKRFVIFEANVAKAKVLQARDTGAEYGVTKFSDLTSAEFKASFFGLNKTKAIEYSNTTEASEYLETDESNTTNSTNPARILLEATATQSTTKYYVPTGKDIPDSWDWRDHKAVTPVKDQGSCGSCWAFSTMQNLEGQYAIKHNQLLVLSEQQLIDCDATNNGCNGGVMQDAMQWLETNGGADLESAYPYKEAQNTCSAKRSNGKVQVTGWVQIRPDEEEIAQALYEVGPLSIAVDADPWQHYQGGITKPWTCSDDLDHGVLLVGYGRGRKHIFNHDYWVIKNSWGSDWGEDGYIRLQRGDGACGVALDVSSAQIA